MQRHLLGGGRGVFELERFDPPVLVVVGVAVAVAPFRSHQPQGARFGLQLCEARRPPT
jgi:hypothetical protein